MSRILFFFLGVPMMIMSFFEAVDVLPHVDTSSLIINGNVVELTETEQQNIMQQICDMFENSHTLPAFGVVFDDMYQEEIQSGVFVSLKFPHVFEVNELPFDELVFKVDPTFQGFNLMRGMKGIFQGRCIYIDLQDKTMQQLSDYINSLESVKEIINEVEPQTENIEQ